jgi:hypothetical protein
MRRENGRGYLGSFGELTCKRTFGNVELDAKKKTPVGSGRFP